MSPRKPPTYEYRVSYHRQAWKPYSIADRYFADEASANRFAALLQGPGRPDLSPLDMLKVERRTLGPWKPCPTPTPAQPKQPTPAQLDREQQETDELNDELFQLLDQQP